MIIATALSAVPAFSSTLPSTANHHPSIGNTASSVLPTLLGKLQPGLYRGISSKGETCAVNVELQARFWNNHPALSILVMNEKALGHNGKIYQMNALARFVIAENHELFKVIEKKSTPQKIEIQVSKKSTALNESPSNMGLKLESFNQGLLIEVQESTQNFFNKTKKVNCWIE